MSQPARWRLYADAVRRMRCSQVVGRTRRLVPPTVLALGLDSGGSPAFVPVARGLGVEAAPQSEPTAPPEADRVFRAFGMSRTFGSPDFWHSSADGLLFLFHLHGFTPLAAYAAGRRTPRGDRFWEEVVSSWLRAEGRPRMPSWHPFPTSQRIVAWCAALSTVEGWPPVLRSAMVEALWAQTRYLRRSVEHDIGGNHVLRNASALVVAGASFPSTGTLPTGLRLLERESRDQFLADGGHEERSTSYHREVTHELEGVSTVLDGTRAGGSPGWLRATTGRARGWQGAMAGPDGQLPLLNDAWEGTPVPRAVTEEGKLTASGYVVLRHAEDHLVFDVGPLSPPHLPPHAHADALSFVLWADGRPLIVDPGSYTYSGAERDSFRSTAAHNTVEVDGRSQCTFWGDFRLAYPPRVRAGPVRRHGGAVVASGWHDGYRRLESPVDHHRCVIWLPEEGVVVVDLLRGRGAHAVSSRLHVAPSAVRNGVTAVGPLNVEALGTAPDVRLVAADYAPYLGTRVASSALEDRRMVDAERPFGWSLLRASRRVVALDRHSVTLDGGARPALTVPLEWS